jgi:hypothetical protein
MLSPLRQKLSYDKRSSGTHLMVHQALSAHCHVAAQRD